MTTPREELTGRKKAVCDVLDEVLFRSHGITSSGHDEELFLKLLEEKGFTVIPDRRRARRRIMDGKS